ncbi:MAG: beta-ketoacyl-ACP synthase II [Candidatus Ancaeobacter aquaticus]|nr:beta-ketoacyl-ACP synthase II [Candidatus Ancaeobacter aquaticus]
MERKVVITGLGVVSPLGIGKEVFWDGLSKGRSGIAPVTLFDPGDFPVKIAGEIDNFDPKQFIQQRKSLKVMARDIQLAVAAAQLGVSDAGIDFETIDPTRLGTSLGTSLISMSIDELSPSVQNSLDENADFSIQKWGAEGMNMLFPLWMLQYLPNMPACHISIRYNTQGPNNTITSACAASTQAIGEAFKVIQRGDADMMIAGGTDSKVNPLNYLRYYFSKCLSVNNTRDPQKVSRPFDKERDGFVIGEGAGIVILEEYEHAKKRGAKIYSELAGYGAASDAAGVYGDNYNVNGLIYSMKNVLEDAECNHDDIDYISVNGLSTQIADKIETEAIKNVFNEHAYSIPMSSIKSMIGHLGASSGVVQLVAAALSLENNIVLPTINYETKDSDCDLDYVPNTPREKECRSALLNSFGLGGQIASLIIKKI